MAEQIEFPTSDGVTLRGRLTLPESGTPAAAMIVAGATGVPESFYHAFADWCAADRGVACLTFTYRGMEDTSPRALRRSRATMADWAIRDAQAARDAMRSRFPDLSVRVVGHSLGGMALPAGRDLTGITHVTTVASGFVHWRDHALPYRRWVWLFWFVLGPVALRLFGYLPSNLFGLGDPLPPGVFRQWRKWCTSPRSWLEDEEAGLRAPDWHRSGAPVRVISFADDEICPEKSADKLVAIYDGAARIDRRHVTPGDHGLQQVGHMGAFSRRSLALWPLIYGESDG